jgi:hypothetical protein
MLMNNATQWHDSRARETVVMVRLTLKHPAQRTKRALGLVIEHDELNMWIAYARKHKCSLEAESIGASEVGRA